MMFFEKLTATQKWCNTARCSIKIANGLLADNVPIEIISKYTGISVEELGKIK